MTQDSSCCRSLWVVRSSLLLWCLNTRRATFLLSHLLSMTGCPWTVREILFVCSDHTHRDVQLQPHHIVYCCYCVLLLLCIWSDACINNQSSRARERVCVCFCIIFCFFYMLFYCILLRKVKHQIESNISVLFLCVWPLHLSH